MPSLSPAETSLSHPLKPHDSFSDVSKMISEFKVKLEVFCKQELDQMFTRRAPRIKIGDRVRVKSSVKTPKFNWGVVTHRSVGVVKSVSDETLIVKFPKSENWKGLVSEMERVTDDSEISVDLQSTIKVGDQVRVKKAVCYPKCRWGSVTQHSVGVVRRLDGENITVDFTEQSNWLGVVSEMEIAS